MIISDEDYDAEWAGADALIEDMAYRIDQLKEALGKIAHGAECCGSIAVKALYADDKTRMGGEDRAIKEALSDQDS